LPIAGRKANMFVAAGSSTCFSARNKVNPMNEEQ
jgi:hypothetical protein